MINKKEIATLDEAEKVIDKYIIRRKDMGCNLINVKYRVIKSV